MRPSNRAVDQMRAVSFTPGFARHAEGPLVKFGDTHVLVTASWKKRRHPFEGSARAGSPPNTHAAPIDP
jgi:ribonuclease PH